MVASRCRGSLLNGLSAKFVARSLGLVQDVKNGVLIVGANEGSISIAKYLEKNTKEIIKT